ncbi:ketopantoate reductase family protein [Candidatus Enterococcus clewellii]|uniref:Ketopantoate reductase N-terminal domain-containing protein n=1 Tax=Candidatus Enterococcus clewellii TaxID=1834193 RepID=A0A242JZ15_9ENTE|nr:2-dehydropantoate 2-reductase N-terminal domain-containing protein [Enterococcus sp. 9E7_DIV0242]OTP10558.1 hypothetical protein A5888_003856 [Enterococcus sp. 9E7_DIV0242]
MKILIYGAGIQGSFLAHSLLKNKNNDVTMLARGQRKIDLETHGLVLSHELQKKKTHDSVNVISELVPDSFFDLIFVTMKYNDFNTVVEPLAANCSQTIIFVGNQMNAKKLEQKIMTQSPTAKTILFGFQNTGGTRKGVTFTILRFGKGNMKIHSMVEKMTIHKTLDEVFKQTQYTWKEEPQLDDWLKSHGVLIMIMNSLDYLFDNNSKKIRHSKDFLNAAAHAYHEVFTLLEAKGHAIVPRSQKWLFGHPTRAKRVLQLLYLTPVMNMAEGNFGEIAAIIETINELKTDVSLTTPNFDKLAKAAITRYQLSLSTHKS